MKCFYGCGKEAKFFFKNGNGCCEKSQNSCEKKRKENSEKKKGKPFIGTPAWAIDGFKYKSWNKGKKDCYSEETLDKMRNSSIGKHNGIASTPEKEESRKEKIKETMKKNHISGGLRKGSGRGKKGWYKNYWCDSSWELAWVIYNLEHNVTFKRNKIGFEYFYKNKKRKYYPDFIISETYYEIKGRRRYEDLDVQNKEKLKQFKNDLIILYEKDMKLYLEYVINKYGKNFIRLYK